MPIMPPSNDSTTEPTPPNNDSTNVEQVWCYCKKPEDDSLVIILAALLNGITLSA